MSISVVLSARMMLDYLATGHGEPRLHEAAGAIERAVKNLFAATPRTTPDLGGSMTCAEVGEAVCRHPRRAQYSAQSVCRCLASQRT